MRFSGSMSFSATATTAQHHSQHISASAISGTQHAASAFGVVSRLKDAACTSGAVSGSACQKQHAAGTCLIATVCGVQHAACACGSASSFSIIRLVPLWRPTSLWRHAICAFLQHMGDKWHELQQQLERRAFWQHSSFNDSDDDAT